MRNDEPLEEWLFCVSSKRPPDKREQALLEQNIDQLEDWLNAPPEGRRREIPSVRGYWLSTARLKPADLARVGELYRRVVATTGTGKTFAEEALLSLLACALDPSTIPFFVSILDLAPPRDKLAARRRQLSLAALALLAYRKDDAGALDALIELTRHPHPQVRSQTVYYLRRIHLSDEEIEFAADEMLPAGAADDASQPAPAGAEDDDEDQRFTLRRPISPELAARITEVALHDPAFEPRFMARMFLRAAGQPVPNDIPAGAYALKVKFKYDKQNRVIRVIELRSEQTLEDLHHAIQDAWDWDDDHLYSFFMNGERGDERYRFSSPWEEDTLWWVNEGVLGELGLILKHKFLYLFDYGDQHEFEIEVVGIREKAEPGKYPRVVESKGKAPSQYGYAEDEDEDEEWEL